jgi:hypothetical protein
MRPLPRPIVILLALSECEGSGVTRPFSYAPSSGAAGERSRMDPSSLSASWQGSATQSTTHPISRRTSAHVPHST